MQYGLQTAGRRIPADSGEKGSEEGMDNFLPMGVFTERFILKSLFDRSHNEFRGLCSFQTGVLRIWQNSHAAR
jgi:hypothetical protein